ncbi:MAG: alkaline phosphatase family protein [Deltaproteobacteria bacterium]|nr:alkaline phosphatase family protein [Deltaproteobacteria bacterium]
MGHAVQEEATKIYQAIFFLVLLGTLLFQGSLRAETIQHHVILLSIDGLRPDYYLHPEKYHLKIPHLRSLTQRGSYAQSMLGVYPTLTYPSHTTIVTGVRPARHGVVSNFIFAPSQGLMNWYLKSTDIQAKTLWEAARDKGLKTAIVTWPVSYGAQVDYLIPENLAVTTDIADLIRQGSTEGLFEDLEKQRGPIKLLPFNDPKACIPLDKMTTDFAAEILRRYKPHLLLAHLLDVDHEQHGTGIDTPQVFASFERIDALIGKLIDAARHAGIWDHTTFIIVGDHGFLPVHAALDFNALLLEKGLLSVDETGKVAQWSAFVQGNGGSAAVYVKDGNDSALRAQVEKLLRAEIASRYAGIVRIVDRGHLDQMGAFPEAILALEAEDGYYFSFSNPKLQVLNPGDPFKGMHGYLPTNPQMATGFIASGRGIRQGVVIPSLRMLDVAPTVAALLHLDLPSAEGVPLVGILAPQR